MRNSTARQLEGTRFPSDLERIDAARLRHHLGEDAYRSFGNSNESLRLNPLVRAFQQAGQLYGFGIRGQLLHYTT